MRLRHNINTVAALYNKRGITIRTIKNDTTMKKVNHYVAWLPEIKGSRSAMYQGIAESEEEFVSMCEEQGYDIHDSDLTIECVKENVRNEMGRPCEKKVSEY